MWIVHVHVHVQAQHVEDFKLATIENAKNSVKEPGIARFDVIQQVDDPTRFVLVEVYHTKEANAAHRETEHYKRWAAKAIPMMVEDRTRVFYENIFPPDQGW